MFFLKKENVIVLGETYFSAGSPLFYSLKEPVYSYCS